MTPSPTIASVNTSYSFQNDGHTCIRISNTSVTDTIGVVIYAQRLCNAGLLHNATIDLGPGDSKFIGPFKNTRFDDVEHRVRLTFGQTTSMNYCILSL